METVDWPENGGFSPEGSPNTELYGPMAMLELGEIEQKGLNDYSAKIWHSNMPHNKIADRKGHQGWMKLEDKHFIFPGGGTMFPDGTEQYIEKLGQYIPV
ncbi:putative S-adenosyl-L-methionine-dependent methyltransferase [Sesbania bispinosa]|nr:putative S-adenosyl-L-methionine-dependent methyltransferase [Sesbania bispinosa]